MLMLNMTIHLRDLLWVFLFIIATGVGTMLMVVLGRVMGILKKVDVIIAENSENIHQLMTVLPETVNSIHEGVQSVKRTVDNAGDTIGFISDSVAPKAGNFLDNADGIIDVMKIVGEVVRAAMHYFKKGEE